MDREKFVGLLLTMEDEDGGSKDVVLTRFLGEGNSFIAYAFAPLSEPHNDGWVMKFAKPDVRFDMSVLHHSLRIASSLYPDHPFLMPPAERMERLSEEMLSRIANPGFPFSVDAFRLIMLATLELLVRHFADAYVSGHLAGDFLEEIDEVRPWLDVNLAGLIESHLDDEVLVDDVRPFFEHCLLALRETIPAWQERDAYFPMSQNRAFRLLGLHLEDFVSFDELLEISGSAQLQSTLRVEEIEGLFHAVHVLYQLACSVEFESGEEEQEAWIELDHRSATAIAAARYQDALASKMGPGMEDVQGSARTFWALTLLHQGRDDEALSKFEGALEVLTTELSQPIRHDVLVAIADLVDATDPLRAAVCTKEAQEIRRTLLAE